MGSCFSLAARDVKEAATLAKSSFQLDIDCGLMLGLAARGGCNCGKEAEISSFQLDNERGLILQLACT